MVEPNECVIRSPGFKVQTDLLFACDAVLRGGRTYPVFAAAWIARSGDPYSDRINSMTKYVVSSTLRDPEWNNTTVISGDPVAAIRRLKEQPGQDIVQYGFGQLSYALLEHGLLDELRLWVHPLFVSQATPCRPAVPAGRHRPGRAHRHARADPAGCR